MMKIIYLQFWSCHGLLMRPIYAREAYEEAKEVLIIFLDHCNKGTYLKNAKTIGSPQQQQWNDLEQNLMTCTRNCSTLKKKTQ